MQAQGIASDRDRILTGYGSAQIQGLLPDVFIEPGDLVIVEGPTFLGVVTKFVQAGAKLILFLWMS
ncbi:hypothetical protein [Dendronalium sp. ChiSLP03b]|uniref:hypothetical protein n=1 Tax=Dendronalium sp. ChiSLP03b TaxID=3075381 RepID=UPI002AD2583A|nr:hypothetical protein [Dendronalium sp. ChiSLP03b]MDZ8203607.1 hypothetical protein [Dendronalium sp. ChiSLP03b]